MNDIKTKVEDIRYRLSLGQTLQEIGLAHGVSRQRIEQIIRKENIDWTGAMVHRMGRTQERHIEQLQKQNTKFYLRYAKILVASQMVRSGVSIKRALREFDLPSNALAGIVASEQSQWGDIRAAKRQEAIDLYRNENLSISKIAQKLKKSPAFVRNALGIMNKPVRAILAFKALDEAVQLYQNGMPFEKITFTTNIKRNALIKELNKRNIPLRGKTNVQED